LNNSLHPSPPPFSETADIETASEDYATRFSGAIGNYFLEVQAQITLDLLKDLPNASILDIGGGHAQMTMPLANNGYRVTVTGSADICRSRLDRYCDPGSFQYITCDSLNLPFQDKQFDVVMTFRLLPHTQQWQRLIQEMCRVAKKAIILDYPDKRSANILYDILFDLKKNMEGNTRTYSLFSRQELRDEFKANHFDTPIFKPEFFVPMVVHRKLKNTAISKTLEAISYYTGLTKILGSPIILRSNINKNP
jgi:ubiquinone/menaquinone biosynthesis C-methylase UbiE